MGLLDYIESTGGRDCGGALRIGCKTFVERVQGSQSEQACFEKISHLASDFLSRDFQCVSEAGCVLVLIPLSSFRPDPLLLCFHLQQALSRAFCRHGLPSLITPLHSE